MQVQWIHNSFLSSLRGGYTEEEEEEEEEEEDEEA